MPKATFMQLIRHQGQHDLSVMLGGKRAIAVATDQVLEIVIQIAHGVPLQNSRQKNKKTKKNVVPKIR
jgi:hypothetical protein